MLNETDVVELLNQAVAERGPDYVYVDRYGNSEDAAVCEYIVNGQASCIVGWVLLKANMITTSLEGDNLNRASFMFLSYKYGFPLTPAAKRLLTIAQDEQDIGMPWGEAVARAKSMVLSTA